MSSHSISKEAKYLIFHKQSNKDDIPRLLPKLKINKYETKEGESIKFLGVFLFLRKNLNWKPFIKYIENKLAQNIGLLFKG